MKKINKYMRDARLTSVRGTNLPQRIKSKNIDKGIKSTSGRKGYAEKCKEQGIFLRVTVDIKDYRQKNPDTGFCDLWSFLCNKYPFIFEKRKQYPGNVQKIIESEPSWQEAYYCGKEDLIKMAEYRISKLLEKKVLKEETIIKIYDVLKKYEKEIVDNDDNNTVEYYFEDEN